MKYSLDVDINIPKVPNHFSLSNNKAINIETLSDDKLRALGAE